MLGMSKDPGSSSLQSKPRANSRAQRQTRRAQSYAPINQQSKQASNHANHPPQHRSCMYVRQSAQHAAFLHTWNTPPRSQLNFHVQHAPRYDSDRLVACPMVRSVPRQALESQRGCLTMTTVYPSRRPTGMHHDIERPV